MSHRTLLFAWVPWGVFLNTHFGALEDGSIVSALIGNKDCKPGITLRLQVAVEAPSQAKGLSNRLAPLKSREGMLFAYSKKQKIEMWMKETYIPLGVAFFDDSGKIVKKQLMSVERDPNQPKKIYSSEVPVTAVIEVSPKLLKQISNDAHLCIEPSKNSTN